jgi:hypothetical protein
MVQMKNSVLSGTAGYSVLIVGMVDAGFGPAFPGDLLA